MKSFKSRLTQFTESVGLDWLPILVDDKKFIKHPTIDLHLYWGLKDQLPKLSGDALQKVVQDLEKRNAEEEKRLDVIESKAITLIGLTGLASVLTVGFLEFFSSDHPYTVEFRVIVLILYSLLGLCFLSTTIFASRVIQVRDQKFMTPDVSNFWKLRDHNVDEIFQQQAADLLQSYINNMALINDKATYIIAAQHWFRNTVILLFVLPLCFGSFLLMWPSEENASKSTATIGPTTQVSATNTPILTLTSTLTLSPPPPSPIPTLTLTSLPPSATQSISLTLTP